MQHFHEDLLEPKLAQKESEQTACAEISCLATLYHTYIAWQQWILHAADMHSMYRHSSQEIPAA